MNIKFTIRPALRSYYVICSNNYINCSKIITSTSITSKFYSTRSDENNKTKVKIAQVLCRRFFSSNSDPPIQKLPPLMNFPEIVWPSVLKSIRVFIYTTFIIRPYMDSDFNIPDFVSGSKKAVEVVSNKLSEGDMKSLDGLVAPDILPNLYKSVSLMSLSQREELAINVEDIYFSFPYQVGVIFDEDSKTNNKKYVEITMVYHIMRGLAAMRSRGEQPPINLGRMPEYQGRLSVCNYRFVREFTKGVESDWTVNLLNHFKPVDYEE